MNCSGGSTNESPLVRQRTGSSSVTVAVLRAVASAENVDPNTLDPLGDVVDPEALKRLLDDTNSAAHVTFSYADHRVVVTGDTVEVY